MILNLLGLQGLNEFIHRSVQTRNLTLVFLGSGAGVYRDLVRLLAGERAQLGALDLSADADYRCRLPVGGVAGYGYPELFSIPGNQNERFSTRW